MEWPHARRAGIARARRHLRARRDLARAQADRAGVADGGHARRFLVAASRRHRVPARDQRVPELRHQRDERRHQLGELRGRALGGRGALHLHRFCRFDRRLPAGTDGDHVRRPAPDEPLYRRRRDCVLGRARRHGAAWRRTVSRDFSLDPYFGALPDDQPERRRDDAVAGGGLRQQPARASRATSAGRLLARSPAASRRRRGHTRRRARRLRQRAGLQLGLLHQSGRARPGRAAVLGTSAGAERLDQFDSSWSYGSPGVPGAPPDWDHRRLHDRRAHGGLVRSRERRPHGHCAAGACGRCRGHCRHQPDERGDGLRDVARLRIHVASDRRPDGRPELQCRLQHAVHEVRDRGASPRRGRLRDQPGRLARNRRRLVAGSRLLRHLPRR